METKRIKCPVCGAILDVKNSQSESVKQIVCPNCKSQLKVSFSESCNDGATQYFGGSSAEDTMYFGGGDKQSASECWLVCNDTKYGLKTGDNIVGRQASTSQATIQIACGDRYMSRQHIRITVTRVSLTQYRAVLSNYHNKNATCVDGQPVADGDLILLNDGDKIKIGNTTITYCQK